MATANGAVPWYRRLFGGGGGAVAAKAAPRPPQVLYACDQCGFSAKMRGVVYDHIKGLHKEILDRHGHITENPLSA
jgi:hypothetical protein